MSEKGTYYSIKKNEIQEVAVNYKLLKQYGIEYISRMSGALWTDYNIHDPGITILEQLCYALTDLGYRTSFDIKDILTPPKMNQPEMEDVFIPSEKILPSHPITLDDLRGWLIQKVPHILNIWIEPISKELFFVDNNNKVNQNKSISLKGFYRITVDMDERALNMMEKKLRDKEYIKNLIRKQFLSVRNLCEDIDEIIILDRVSVGICMNIEIEQELAYEPVFREVNRRLDAYINNEWATYEKKYQLNISDVINLIMDIPGVINVLHFHFVYTKNDKEFFVETKPEFTLTLAEKHKKNYAFRFDPSLNETVVTRGLLSVKVEKLPEEIVQEEIIGDETTEEDNILPISKNRELDNYISIQDEFPKIYQLGREGISASASELHQTQRLQLKAYLIFFDQILADYLSQLNSVKDLLSWKENVDHTYFYKKLSNDEIVDFEKLVSSYSDMKKKEVDYQEIIDADDIRTDRKNRFLNHLIARFNEEFVNYSVLQFVNNGKISRDFDKKEMIHDKITFLKNYAAISANRSRATDYSQKEHIPSMIESRIYSKLGLGIKRVGKSLTPTEKTDADTESYNKHFGLHIYEHILFRPLKNITNKNFIRFTTDVNQKTIVSDPYSMRVTVVVTGWLRMCREKSFRNFIEQIVRVEIPAHIAVKICWLNAAQMNEMEQAYSNFMNVLPEVDHSIRLGNIKNDDPIVEKYNTRLELLVKIFSSLRSIYPPLQLYSPDNITVDYPSILNYSMLSSHEHNRGTEE